MAPQPLEAADSGHPGGRVGPYNSFSFSVLVCIWNLLYSSFRNWSNIYIFSWLLENRVHPQSFWQPWHMALHSPQKLFSLAAVVPVQQVMDRWAGHPHREVLMEREGYLSPIFKVQVLHHQRTPGRALKMHRRLKSGKVRVLPAESAVWSHAWR